MSEKTPKSPAPLRCAIYTRKSTEEGLDQDFNSLDAQREAGEAYVRSQRHLGWECLPEHYDDGGFTGANMERPALQRLLADIEASKIDVVVVYKVDRLSRSLLDFARLIETFDRRGISFVSVTQQFNTATSLGRLVLNILLSFAQFEREMTAEQGPATKWVRRAAREGGSGDVRPSATTSRPAGESSSSIRARPSRSGRCSRCTRRSNRSSVFRPAQGATNRPVIVATK
jgi:site-specific DNA recombinase